MKYLQAKPILIFFLCIFMANNLFADNIDEETLATLKAKSSTSYSGTSSLSIIEAKVVSNKDNYKIGIFINNYEEFSFTYKEFYAFQSRLNAFLLDYKKNKATSSKAISKVLRLKGDIRLVYRINSKDGNGFTFYSSESIIHLDNELLIYDFVAFFDTINKIYEKEPKLKNL